MGQISVRPAYTVDAFCGDFGIGRSTFYAEVRAGRLKAFKVGDKTMIAGEDAMAWRERYREAGYRRAAYPAGAAV
jgi:hypothetical protein